MKNMRFASLGGTSNYAQAGKAVADDAARILDTTRKNSVNFGELAQASRELQSKKNAAMSKADSEVAQAKVAADAKVKVNKEEIYRDELRAKSRRKAGVVAALGKAGAGMADLFMGKPPKRDHSSSIALQEKLTKDADELRAGIKPIDFNGGNSTPPASGKDGGGTNVGGTAASSTSTTAASAGGTAPAGGTFEKILVLKDLSGLLHRSKLLISQACTNLIRQVDTTLTTLVEVKEAQLLMVPVTVQRPMPLVNR